MVDNVSIVEAAADVQMTKVGKVVGSDLRLETYLMTREVVIILR